MSLPPRSVAPMTMAALMMTRFFRMYWPSRVGANGKRTKVPYCSATRRASTVDPATWLTLEQARALQLDGIGYVFANDAVGIDLDKCREPSRGAARYPLSLGPTAIKLTGGA